MFLESSVVHINYTKTSCLPFSKVDPIHSLGKLHGFCYFMIAHTQPFSCMNLVITKNGL